ncbi:hypothetical protein VKT23_000100 [Stygiomarasmius scandens]|uniref:Peptidase C14 caspase domain-containing protein n=1 Tax=Marasmiellus scandens TaxID=2682957 RepID=A0ABR1K743_9AGAR
MPSAFLHWLKLAVQNIAGPIWNLLKMLNLPKIFPSYPDTSTGTDLARGSSVKRPSFTRLHALLIGIDKYKDRSLTLYGAVSDVNRMEDFLVTDCKVPQNCIAKLCDKQATRKKIITAIEDITRNPDVKTDDPILIYFAGHGSETKPPVGWPTSSKNGMIQMLLPYDFSKHGSQDLQGQGIWDLTMNRLLANIARQKSDNITVILDCCHSGSGTRDPKLVTRGIQLPNDYSIPPNLPLSGSQPETESGGRGPTVAKGYEKNDSHVLLAACKSTEAAAEFKGFGRFTKALLDFLKNKDLAELTYAGVIDNLPKIENQNPQCEGGIHQDRLFFTSKIVPRLLQIKVHSDNSHNQHKYILNVGEIHRIGTGAQFRVYSDKVLTELLGIVKADKIDKFRTRCTANPPFTSTLQNAYALQIHSGEVEEMRLFIEGDNEANKNNAPLSRLKDRLRKERANKCKRTFRFVEKEEKHDLVIKSTKDYVHFEIKDDICVNNHMEHMHFNVPVQETDTLLSILRSASDFYWHLRHCPSSSSKYTSNITFECCELVESDPKGCLGLTPLAEGRNLYQDKEIVINADDASSDPKRWRRYGCRITNNLDFPLYAALFYFDVGNLSIVPYHLPPVARDGKAEFSIHAKNSLTLGFGDGGGNPKSCALEKGQVEVGFLKLYLSTQYVNFSSIPQSSPLQKKRAIYDNPLPPPSFWDILMIPVIQRGPKSSSKTSE